MMKHNQDGAANGLVISLVFAVLLLVGALGFGGWAFSSRQDYKNNVDSKISAADAAARKQEDAVDAIKYAQQAKYPLQAYKGSEANGSLVVNFPKTWSADVNDTGTSGTLIDGYFTPGILPALGDPNTIYALRVQLLGQSYSQTAAGYAGQPALAVTAYSLPKVPNTLGIEVVGQLPNTPTGTTSTMVILPLRSQTLEIWTVGSQYLPDFNNIILKNLSFSP